MKKKLAVLSVFTGVFGRFMKNAMCNYVILFNNLVLYKKS